MIDTTPMEEAINESADSNYTYLAAIGEIVDNALQAVVNNLGAKDVTLFFDLDQGELIVLDNGFGCDDPEAFSRIGMRQNLRREDDSRLCAVSKFQDYFQAAISRYGVGSYYALNKLGDSFRTRSKKSGVTTVTRVVRLKMSGYKCQCFTDMNVQSLHTDIGNETIELDSGTEIKVLKLHPDLIHLLKGTGQETLCKNLKAIYYSYLGVETSPQIQGSPGIRIPGFLHFQQTMKRCFAEGVWDTPKGAVGSRGGLDMLTKLQNAFRSPGLIHPTIRPTDIKIKCLENGNLQEFELSNLDCFLDSICKNAKDCFPLHFSIDIEGTQAVVMGAIFYFPILNGEETCPDHDEFLEQQMNTQKLIVFWEGRLLTSAAGNLMPAFLKTGKGSMIPDRVHRRFFTVLYVDSAFQPDYNKRNLSSSEALKCLKKQFTTSVYTKAFEWWLLRSHRKHDQEIMWGRSPEGEEEVGVYTETVGLKGRFTRYTMITRLNEGFKQGDLIKIVTNGKTLAKQKSVPPPMGKIVCFRQNGHEAEGRTEGFVEIQQLSGTGTDMFEVESVSFELTTHELRILEHEEEKTAREDIARGIVTVAQVTCKGSTFSVGRDVVVEITFFNCFRKRVMNHTCNFEMLISQGVQSELPAVSMSELSSGHNTFSAFATKSGHYALSFKRLDVGKNVIKLEDKDGKEFDVMPLYIQAGPPETLEFPPVLKTTLGSLITNVPVKVLDKFGNNVAKSEIDRMKWQFWSRESLQFSPHDISKEIQSASHDGTITFSNLCLPDAPLGLSAQSSGKTIKFTLQGIRVSDKYTCTADFSVEVTHGAPCVLEIKNFPATIQNDSALEGISVSVSDVSQNLCSTVTGTILALSSNLSYISPSSSYHDHHLLCFRPLSSDAHGNMEMYRSPVCQRDGLVHSIMQKDPLAIKAVTSPADKTLELDLSQQKQVKARLILSNRNTFLVHDSLGVFVEGDFVMIDKTDRVTNSLVISNFFRPYDVVLAKVVGMECSSFKNQSQPCERLSRRSNIVLHVAIFENVFDLGEEVKATAAGYDAATWWDATIVKLLDDGTYEVKWALDEKDSNGNVLKQKDVLKRGNQLHKKRTPSEDRRRVKDSKVSMQIDVRQIVSRAFVLHTSVLCNRSKTDSGVDGSGQSQESLTKSVGTFAKNVWFGNEDDFATVLPAQIDFLFTQRSNFQNLKENKWFDCSIDGDAEVLHRRVLSTIVSSGMPKYMELYDSEKMLQVSKIHYDQSFVPANGPYARNREFPFSLHFRDESGALILPPKDSKVSCSWMKLEDGSSQLNADCSLPPYTLCKSTDIEVVVSYAMHVRDRQRLELTLPVKMQPGDPAKLCLQLVDKDYKSIEFIKVNTDCSLTIQILDRYNEPIPNLGPHTLSVTQLYLIDSVNQRHTMQSRQEDHRSGEQRWTDVTRDSGHQFEKGNFESVGDIFNLPFCHLGGKAGNVCLEMKAILHDSNSGETFEISSDAHFLKLGAGDATKVEIQDADFIELMSGVDPETVTIEVSVTDDYDNQVDCLNAPKLHISNEPSTTAGLRSTVRDFVKDQTRNIYSLSFEAGPYPPGTFEGTISVKMGRQSKSTSAQTGRQDGLIKSQDYVFRVKQSNRVESVTLQITKNVVMLPDSPHNPILCEVEADFATEDTNLLPKTCLTDCLLVLTDMHGAARRIAIESCQPNVQWKYGHILTLSTPFDPWRTPGTYQVSLEYTEKRPNLQAVATISNVVAITLLPGVV